MKMVITGASGFLGSRAAQYYKEKYEVVTPVHAEMDITDSEAVKRYMERMKPDVIIHCAAVSDVGACDREPERTWKINVTGSENIAKAARDMGARCLLCSSDQVYFGSAVQTPHTEDEPLAPCNEYGRQKLTMEQRCLRHNPDSVLLRLSWLYDENRRNGQEHDNFMRKLIEDMNNKRELTFPRYDTRGITNAAEVVRNLEKAFDLPGGVYNFGAYNNKNTYEMMKGILQEIKYADVTRILENRASFAENPRNIAMNIDKIKGMGITFQTTEQGIKEVLANCHNLLLT